MDYEIKDLDGEIKEHTGEGYIILAREMYKQSKTWQALNPVQKIVMITLLLMANYKDGQWWDDWKKEWVTVKRGQMITSLDSIKKACGKGVSIKNIRTALVNLEKMEFLANQSAKHYRLITLMKYDFYQTQDNYLAKQSASARQSLGKASATNKQDKQDKQGKQKDIIYPPEFEEFWQTYLRQTGIVDAFKAWNARLKEKINPDDMIQAAKNYMADCKQKGTEVKFIKHPKTFLGPGGHIKEWKDKGQAPPEPPPREPTDDEKAVDELYERMKQDGRFKYLLTDIKTWRRRFRF